MSDFIDLLFNIIIITSFIQPVGLLVELSPLIKKKKPLLVELSPLISFPSVTASATS
jgi:hypothetical protein